MEIIGRACCRECGGIVIGEVEKDIRCPKCGRVFQIPNQLQYTAPAARLLGLSRHQASIAKETEQLPLEHHLEVEIHEYDGSVLIVAEFPGHRRIGEILHRREEGNKLVLESATNPSYRSEVVLPEWAKELSGICLRNCIFSMRFCREPPL